MKPKKKKGLIVSGKGKADAELACTDLPEAVSRRKSLPTDLMHMRTPFFSVIHLTLDMGCGGESFAIYQLVKTSEKLVLTK